MRNSNAPSRGFTIIELIVTIGLTVLMLVLINQLFFNTSRAVSQGAQLSEIIGKSRAASDQFSRDAAAMIGPTSSPPGFLVIINKRFNVPVPAPRAGGGVELTRSIRSDQLVFIRSADGLSPVTPGDVNKFTNSAIGSYARVWYGHVRLTDPSGTADTGDVGNAAPGNLNRLGTNWSIGRQVLLFTATPDTVCATPTGTSYVFNSSVSASDYPNAPLKLLYMGLTDVFAFPLQDGTNGVVDPNLANNKWQLGGGLAENIYEDLALGYAFGNERLRLNPVPAPTVSLYSSWQIAQMHSAFLANASDLEIAFAADLDGDGAIDVVTGSGQIFWYDAYNYPVAPLGYTLRGVVPYEPRVDAPTAIPALADAAFVWRHDDVDPTNSTPQNIKWPYLIRIRYRLHDARGEFMSLNDPSRATDGIDNNGDGRIDEADEAPEQGKWFEQIIKVNRP